MFLSCLLCKTSNSENLFQERSQQPAIGKDDLKKCVRPENFLDWNRIFQNFQKSYGFFLVWCSGLVEMSGKISNWESFRFFRKSFLFRLEVKTFPRKKEHLNFHQFEIRFAFFVLKLLLAKLCWRKRKVIVNEWGDHVYQVWSISKILVYCCWSQKSLWFLNEKKWEKFAQYYGSHLICLFVVILEWV